MALNLLVITRCLELSSFLNSDVEKLSGAKLQTKPSEKGMTAVIIEGTRGQIQKALERISTLTGEKVRFTHFSLSIEIFHKKKIMKNIKIQ